MCWLNSSLQFTFFQSTLAYFPSPRRLIFPKPPTSYLSLTCISASSSNIWAKFDSSKHPANIIRLLLRQPSSYSHKTSEIYYGKLTASIIKTDPYSIFKSA